MTNLSRLSDLNIADDVLRAHYYSRVKAYMNQAGVSDLVAYTIRVDELYRADLVAQRAHSTPELEWLVYLACDISDSCEPLPVGEVITMPSAAWVRSSMRQFIDEMGLVDA